MIILLIISVVVGTLLTTTLLLSVARSKRTRNGKVLTTDEAYVLDCFERFNCFVWGVKRAGKDLLFMHVINLLNEKHFANIPYSPLTEVLPLADLNIGDNEYSDFITGNIKKLPSFKFEGGRHYFASDIGIFCPSHENKRIDEEFPSMPAYLALSSQIDGMNIHMNSQAFGRPYIKLREQCGAWFQVLYTEDNGENLVVHFISYGREKDAENDVRPEDLTLAERKKRNIKYRKFVVSKWSITYDTHYFRTLVYDVPQKYYANGVKKQNDF